MLKYSLSILDRLRISVILVDRDFHIVYCNQKARVIAGTDLDLSDKNVLDLIKLKNAEGKKLDLEGNLRSIFTKSSGPLYDNICSSSRTYHDEFWFSVCIFPLEDEADEIKHVVICLQDITISHEIETNLKELEIRYETVFNSVNDGIFLYEPDKFRLIDVNDRIGEMYGFTKKELQTKKIEDLSVTEEGFTNKRGLLYALRAINGDIQVHEWHAKDKTGKTFWTRLLMKKVIIGEVPFLMGIIKDIDDQKKAELSLRVSKERLQLAHEVTKDGMWDWDISREQIYYSPRFFTMLGYEPGEFVNTIDSVYKLIHPDDIEKVNQTYSQQNLLHSDMVELEIRGRKKDGSYAWILSKGKVFARDTQGLPTRVVGTTVDISQHKRQEDIRNVLINISEAINTTRNLDEFFESIQFHLGRVIDTKNCYIALYDKTSNKITLPFHRDERDRFKEFPAGKTITSYVIRTGRVQLLNTEKINELIAAGEIEVIGALSVSWLGVPLRIENELIGVFVVQSYDKSVIYTEDDVQILEFVSDQIAMAISRKKDHDRIYENQVRQRQIFESLPDGLLVISREGRIIDYNSRTREMLNCMDETIRNSYFSQFVCPSDLEKVTMIYEKTIETGIRTQDEIKMIRADQTEFFAEISMGLVRHAQDKPETFVIIVKDIDERKASEIKLKIAKEKAEEADRLKTAFLSNMSHEIRTPMNAIIGFAELLSYGEATADERKEFIAQINYGAESLMRLIDDIIDIAKIEAGQIKICNVFFDLSSVFRDLRLIFTRNLQRQNKNNIQLVEDNSGYNPSIQLYGDQIRIRQILNNLLSNAIKFTEKGEIRFGIRSISDGMISFYVKDSGIGIPHDKLGIIFDRFRQGHETKAKSYGGTGLGLAISKQLVELMGGSISVSSEKGIGSEFIFSIPYLSIEENTVGMENIFDKIELNWKNKTILIAEDDPSNFFLLSEILKSTDVKIIRASDGREAVEIVNTRPQVDLVLMDVQLPSMSGYEAARIIKERRPDLPVIAQTAYGLSDEKQESLKAGCDDYIQKPIKTHDLFVVISKYFHA